MSSSGAVERSGVVGAADAELAPDRGQWQVPVLLQGFGDEAATFSGKFDGSGTLALEFSSRRRFGQRVEHSCAGCGLFI